MSIIRLEDYTFNARNVSCLQLKGNEICVFIVGTAVYHTIRYKTNGQAKTAYASVVAKWNACLR